MSPEEIAALVEFTEGDAYAAILSAGSPDMAERLGVRLVTFGPARARSVGSVNVTLLNAVVGLGVGRPATEQVLDEIIGFFRAQGADFMVQVSPAARPAEIPSWLEERGFKYRDEWVKVYRGAEPPPPTSTALEIREAGPEQAEAFVDTALRGFEMPPQAAVLKPLFAAGIGQPGWRYYLGYDGDMPVSTAALYVKDGVGWLGYGATLPSHRRMGSQNAMFARRIRDGIDMGCKWLVTETDAETAERPSPSYRNMVRSGFVAAYNRPNYVLHILPNGQGDSRKPQP